jgi:hypothetical protein
LARRLAWTLACLMAAAFWARGAEASEGGASFYLLGSGGPEAAIMPPLKGVYFDNEFFYENATATAGKQFLIGGNLVSGLHVSSPADFVTVLWAPSTNVLGGVFAVGGALAFGDPNVSVSAILRGPLGRQFSISNSDSALVFADPIGLADLGWKWGDFHLEASSLVNFPVGEYRADQLANLAFHRWAGDTSLAGTWHDDRSGWDVSAKAGLTFNGENPSTQYVTGTEFHVEGSVEKTVSKHFALAVQAYHFAQITGDSGPGATLGPNEGRATGVGGGVTYKFDIGKTPANLRLRGMTEFGVVNRATATTVALDLSLPLYMKLPPAPAH